MADETLFTIFRFDVQLNVSNAAQFGLTNPLCNAAFAECDGLEMTMEPKTFSEGGNNTQQVHLPGPVKYGNLTLKRGMTANIDLWRWFSVAVGPEGRGATADGVVIMRDGTGKAQLEFKLFGCLPVKMRAPSLNAKDGLIAIEEMQLVYSFFNVQPA